MSVRTSELVFFSALAIFGIGGCGSPANKQESASTSQAPQEQRLGQLSSQTFTRAPEFNLKDLSGSSVRLSDLRGKAVLLDFWATWCGPCRESIPFFESMYEKHKPRGLEVVGVNEDVETAGVAPYVQHNHMTYHVLLDPENRLFDDYDIRGLPATFLLDRRGRIRARWIGFDPDGMGEIEAALKAVLDEPLK